MRRQLLQALPRLTSSLQNGGGVSLSNARSCQLIVSRGFADDSDLLKTPLYDFHVEHGGGFQGSIATACFWQQCLALAWAHVARHHRGALSPTQQLKCSTGVTCLHLFSCAPTGRMVPFAGWSMPIQYKDSIMDATKHCRENGSLFDVSHMCGLTLKVPSSASPASPRPAIAPADEHVLATCMPQ